MPSTVVIRQLRVFVFSACNGHSYSLYHDWKHFLPHVHLASSTTLLLHRNYILFYPVNIQLLNDHIFFFN